MTVDDAYTFFDSVPTIKRKLKTLIDVSLHILLLDKMPQLFQVEKLKELN